MKSHDLVVLGGGAAGFFCAIRYAERNPEKSILICEKRSRLLEKVRVSGGGRCNVTHDWSTPKTAADYYPRGAEFLQNAFAEFHCGDMRKWLKNNGVETKVESDGRVFPVSDSSKSITDLFEQKAAKLGVKVEKENGLKSIKPNADDGIILELDKGQYFAKNVLVATGSNRPVWEILKDCGHEIAAPVASLFAFNSVHRSWSELAGVSVPNASVQLENSEYITQGPLLITHKGFSGPAILKLSAWAARELEKRNYEFGISISWSNHNKQSVLKLLKELRDEKAKQDPASLNPIGLPKRLNKYLFQTTEISSRKMAELGNKHLERWASALADCAIDIKGKATNKEEFVTCGGINLSEVNPETMESKLVPHLFFAGEVLNIDAITGGFNFQACWSGANLAAKSMA